MCIGFGELLSYGSNSFSRGKAALKGFFRKKPTKLADIAKDAKIKCPYEGKALSPEEIKEMREKERLANIAYAQAYLEQKHSRILSLL